MRGQWRELLIIRGHRRDPLIICGVAITVLVGAVSCFGGYLLTRDSWALRMKGVSARGIVVEHRAEVVTHTDTDTRRSSESTVYYPIVEFQTKDGRSVRFESGTGSNPPLYKKGEAVPVRHDVNDPAKAEIHSFFTMWGGSLIAFGLGAAFFLGAMVILHVTRWGRD